MARDLPQALLELSDTSDIADLDGYADRLARWSVELTPVTAAAVVLRDENGTLRVGAARPEWIRALPEAAIAGGAGLMIECCDRAEPVWVSDMTERNWPQFTEVALALGICGGFAVPLSQGGRLFGALAVYHAETDGDLEDIQGVCRALGIAAAIGLANFAEHQRLRALTGHLQTALESRIVIEQAKGILAERRHTSVDQAFAILRRLARENNLRLHDVARATVETLKSVR